jgi:hypothetical protein
LLVGKASVDGDGGEGVGERALAIEVQDPDRAARTLAVDAAHLEAGDGRRQHRRLEDRREAVHAANAVTAGDERRREPDLATDLCVVEIDARAATPSDLAGAHDDGANLGDGAGTVGPADRGRHVGDGDGGEDADHRHDDHQLENGKGLHSNDDIISRGRVCP